MAETAIAERFFALTPERVLDAIESIGRRTTGSSLALNSLENRVYEVETEEGERLVGTFYRPGRWSREALLCEHAFLAELAHARPCRPGGDGAGRAAGKIIDRWR